MPDNLPARHHTAHCRTLGWHMQCDGRCVPHHHTGDPAHPRALVAVDVDGVLNYTLDNIAPPGFDTHRYTGPHPTGRPVDLDVHLNPEHGAWLAQIVDHGGSLVWASTWHDLASTWIGPRIGLHPDIPAIDVGIYTGDRFGWSLKFPAVTAHAGNRPLAWIDDHFGGKETGWAEDRTEDGIPTLVMHTAYPVGLDRDRLDTVLTWLDSLAETT